MDNKLHHDLIIAGFGGQGVLKLGQTLAEAAMNDGREVIWTPAYGPEMRGGPSFCTVIVSSEKIGSPAVASADTAIILDRVSLAKYQSRVRDNGLLLMNSSLVDVSKARTDVRSYAIPANEMAEELGDSRISNMIMLGAFLYLTGIASPASVIAALSAGVSERNKHLIPLNEIALQKGADAVRGK
ncbi:MAG: 2-oxoacid:acceptor oxidoreductase family protein [bacterium]